MKLCKDCKFFEPHPSNDSTLHKCTSPNIPNDIDIVSGEVFPSYCHIERSSYHSCGRDAKFFEPINQSEPEIKSKTFWQKLFNF